MKKTYRYWQPRNWFTFAVHIRAEMPNTPHMFLNLRGSQKMIWGISLSQMLLPEDPQAQKGLKSVHFKKTFAQSSFISKVLPFSLKSKQMNKQMKSNDKTFERNEDCATVFLKWTDFSLTFNLSKYSLHHIEHNISNISITICLLKYCFFFVSNWDVQKLP